MSSDPPTNSCLRPQSHAHHHSQGLLPQTQNPRWNPVSNPAQDSSLCRAAARRLRLLQLLLATCVRFSCSSPISTARSPIAYALAAAPQLRPLQLLLPDCVRFNCSSLIASACSLTCSGRFQPMPNVLEHSLWSSMYEGHVSLV